MCEMNQEEEEEYDDRTDERAEAGIRIYLRADCRSFRSSARNGAESIWRCDCIAAL